MLVAGWIAGPPGFNPYVTVSSAATMIEDLIYTPLVDLGANMQPRWSTSLAYKVDLTDKGRRYVLHLRHGARWSDGKPLTAKDVVFTLKLLTNAGLIAPHTSDFSLMTSVRALDPYTVAVTLSQASPPFLLNALSRNDTLILPEHILGKYPPTSEAEAKFVNADADFSQHPIVAGAWRILRNVPDSYLILQPNPTYWGPSPP